MASLLEYFKNDFRQTLPVESFLEFQVNGKTSDTKILRSVRYHAESSTRLLTFFVPDLDHTYPIVRGLVTDWRSHYKDTGAEVHASYVGDVSGGVLKSVDSARMYVYTERQMGDAELSVLSDLAKQVGVHVTIRSKDYVARRTAVENPLAFISHDSRDKDLIARPIAQGLSSRLCTVWYDEYSLKVGDSLRESIQDGIKHARKCIVILTKNFISNPGWTKREFNAIFTSEIITNRRLVLPIWFGLTKYDVYEYSPDLVDTFALTWPNPEKFNGGTEAREYKESTEILISKLHAEIVQ